MSLEPECECPGPGFCPRYQIPQDANTWGICSGKGRPGKPCPPEKSLAYRAKWRRDLERAGGKGRRVPTPQPAAGPKSPPRQQPADGPGTELKALLSALGIHPTASCQCRRRMAAMNAWGVSGCRERREEIVGWLREGAPRWGWTQRLAAAARAVATGIAFSLDWSDPFPSLVRLAIDRAAEKERAAAGELPGTGVEEKPT